jgi:hypothetical protein
MKLPFAKTDPASALAKAEEQLSAAEARLTDLQSRRSEALLEDGLTPVERVDHEIAQQRRTISILDDRIAALEAELERQRVEALERERAAAIAVLEKRFAKRVELAREVEKALEVFASRWHELLDSRADIIGAEWPSALPHPVFGELQSRIDKELAWALYSAGRPAALRPCSIPAPTNAGLGITGVHAKGLAGAVQLEHEGLLARLRNLPLPDDDKREMETAA